MTQMPPRPLARSRPTSRKNEPPRTVIIGRSEQVLAQQGPCLVAAAVNQQGGDVTEGEGRHDREERLSVELARLGPSLHASVPN